MFVRLSFIISLFSLPVLPAAAQTMTEQPINQVDSCCLRQGYWEFTGSMKKDVRFRPDQVMMCGIFIDGKKAGTWIEYYPSGNVKSMMEYESNRPKGGAVFFYPNGNIEEEGNWIGNRWVGEYKLYYENGQLRQHFNYSATGKRSGAQLYYHPNGNLSIQVYMEDGKEEGWRREYTVKGELLKETFFNGGVVNTAKTRSYYTENNNRPVNHSGYGFYPPTQREATGNDYVLYNSNKQIVARGTFKNQKLIDGEKRTYDENGLLVRVELYKDGKYIRDGAIGD